MFDAQRNSGAKNMKRGTESRGKVYSKTEEKQAATSDR